MASDTFRLKTKMTLLLEVSRQLWNPLLLLENMLFAGRMCSWKSKVGLLVSVYKQLNLCKTNGCNILFINSIIVIDIQAFDIVFLFPPYTPRSLL